MFWGTLLVEIFFAQGGLKSRLSCPATEPPDPRRFLNGSLKGLSPSKLLQNAFNRGRVNREVQTVNWEGGGEGAVERGVKSSLKKAHFNRELEEKRRTNREIVRGVYREVQTVN